MIRDEDVAKLPKLAKLSTKEVFPKKSQLILEALQGLSETELAEKFKIKNKILAETDKNLRNFNKLLFIPAFFMYNGVSYKKLEIAKYREEEFNFISKKLFILSAFYGILHSFTSVRKYRLDMTIPILDINLYTFWRKEVNDFLLKELSRDDFILNLASTEFSKIIDRKKIKVVDVEFYEADGEKLKNISTYSKQARGAMLNYIILNKIENIEDLKNFEELNYKFEQNLSNSDKFVFIR